MTKYLDVVKIATGELGYVEGKGNYTKYGKWFGLDGVSWCGIFVSWVYSHAGYPLGKIDFYKGFASCQYAYKFFKEKNKITQTPMPGDIVFFDFDGNGKFEHTGLFVGYINDEYFETIEGNTSTKDNRNGGCVMTRKRKYSQSKFVHV